MRCVKCGLRFTSKEITAEDEDGRDLCPACCAPINPKEAELAITITDALNGNFDKRILQSKCRESTALYNQNLQAFALSGC